MVYTCQNIQQDKQFYEEKIQFLILRTEIKKYDQSIQFLIKCNKIIIDSIQIYIFLNILEIQFLFKYVQNYINIYQNSITIHLFLDFVNKVVLTLSE
ncbi:hypothetical protein pb186bvf_009331 [Paramecium bursaria]